MKHQHEDYIEFVQNQIDGIQEQIDALRQEKTAQPFNEGHWEAEEIEKIIHEYEVQQASWLANRDTLERHYGPREQIGAKRACPQCYFVFYPCPTHTATTKHLDLVMGERNV